MQSRLTATASPSVYAYYPAGTPVPSPPSGMVLVPVMPAHMMTPMRGGGALPAQFAPVAPYPVAQPTPAKAATVAAPPPQRPQPLPGDSVPSISFTLNGKAITVNNPDPLMTLNDWIRAQPGFTGTKKGCGEGGCGACTVQIEYTDLALGTSVKRSINSCLRPLCGVNGMAVTTIEALGSLAAGFDAIQERLADANGSQCGYCSPGMVMNMYNLLQTTSAPTQAQIEAHFDGNLCRCTGYRPILDAFKSFAVDARQAPSPAARDAVARCKALFSDIEELAQIKPGPHPTAGKCCGNKSLCGTPACTSSKPASVKALNSTVNGVTWVQATTLTAVYQLQQQYANQAVKLVVGNTGYGVYKTDLYDVYIDISTVPDLQGATLDPVNGAVFGAAVRLTDVLNALTAYGASSQYPAYATNRFSVLAAHMLKIAGTQVRNAGSWVGGLVLANQHSEFASDMATILAGAGAVLTIGTAQGTTTTDVLSFLSMPLAGKVVISVSIPFGQQGEVFRTYKVMPRFENAHATVNAAISVVIGTNGLIGSAPVVVYGGLNGHASRMPRTEASLAGQDPTSSTAFQASLAVLAAEAVIDPALGKTAYRTSLVQTLFYKFFLALQPSLPPQLQSVVNPPVRPVSDGVQSYQTVPNEYPVSEPLPKLEARQQASGEIKYASDIPAPPGTLCAALLLSTVASATIKSIDASPALSAPGVVAFFSASDLTTAQNTWGPAIQDEELFASTTVSYYGQPLGLLIADTQAHADAAVTLVNVTYANVSTTPLITNQDAITAQSFFPNYPQAPTGSPLVSGNVSQGFAQATNIVQGTIETGWQQHFGLEPHAVLCIPDENNLMRIQAATQYTALLQSSVASLLGRQAKDVIIEPKKIGGSYGARITRNVPYMMVTAFAADRLGVPVRMNIQFNSLVTMLGKRPSYLANYKIGTDSTGKLLAIQLDTYINQGAAFDGASFEAGGFLQNIDNAYYCPNWQATATLCKTNTPPSTSMRGPGWTQAVFIAEQMLEHVAQSLGLPPDQVKALNFYQQGQTTPSKQYLRYFSIPELYSQIQLTSDYQARAQAITAWNAANRWLKKGISINFVKFGVYWAGDTFGATLTVFPDGSVVLTHSGVEIGQGINTKVAQVAAMMLGIPMSALSVQDASTTQQPNAGATGGSVTTGLNAMAVINAASTLNARLAPIRASLGQNASWQQVVAAAFAGGVDLCVRGWFDPQPSPDGPAQYMSYGAAVAETQVDILTGEVQVPRVDILFDLGISLNPAIDIGQVEGAFVQGMGLHMFEQTLYDDVINPGTLISDGTWEYKPPGARDIPIDFRVSLLKNAPNPLGVLRSKCVGEPPLTLGCAPLFAARHALAAALADAGSSAYFVLNSPATPENLQTTVAPVASQFVLS